MAKHGIGWEPAEGLTRKERRERARAYRAALATVEAKQVVEKVEDLPYIAGRKNKQGGPAHAPGNAGFYLPTKRLRQPPHQCTSMELAAMYPALASRRWPSIGPVLGLDMLSGSEFCFDPWRLYDLGIIPSTGILLMGGYRQGKSFLLKRMISLLALFGRQAINTSDSKGEHVFMAQQIGGDVAQIGTPGSGTYVNPLQRGPKVGSYTEEAFDISVRIRRQLVIQQMVEIIRDDRTRTAASERSLIEWALDEAVARTNDHPTITDIVRIFAGVGEGRETPPAALGQLTADAANLFHTLRELTDGALSGMFEKESTIRLRTDSPYTVFDTSAAGIRGQTALALTQAVTNAWVTEVLADKGSGRKYLIAREEGWRDLRTASALQAQLEQQKLAGDLGIAQLLVVHEGGDFDSVGDIGSRERELAQQLVKGFATKISFAQEPGQLAASARAVGLTQEQVSILRDCQKGQAMVTAGTRTTMIDTFATSSDWEVTTFDTDRAMKDDVADVAAIDDDDYVPLSGRRRVKKGTQHV